MPDWTRYVRERLEAAALPPGDAETIVEELAQHLAQRYDEAIAAGATEPQALAAATADIPDTATLVRSVARARRAAAPEAPPRHGGRTLLAAVLCDVRYALRLLRRTPGFALVAVTTLALGIGGTTAIFSVAHGILLRPLPYPDPDRLVVVGQDSDGRAGRTGYATFLDWSARARTFEAIAAVGGWNPTLVEGEGPERLDGMRVTHGFFEMLGVQPALGRLFTGDDDRPGAPRRVVILSDRLWQRRFGSDPGVVGRGLHVNGVDYRVVGVLPPAFEPLISAHFHDAAEIWSPLGYDVSLRDACRSCRHLQLVGRLQPGVTAEAARAELEAIQRRLLGEHPNDYVDRAMAVVRLHDELVHAIRPTLRVLMMAVLLVLALAVANLASLLLARAGARQREMAVRAALGAARRRVVGQLLTEGVVLAALGGAAGALAALVATPLLVSLAPADLPRAAEAGVDGVALAVAGAIALGCGLLIGLAPALRLSRVSLSNAMKAASRGIQGVEARPGRSVLVATEVALAVVLLAGAGLMVRTMAGLLRVETGFDPRQVVAMNISAVGSSFADEAQVRAFQRALLERVRAIPGVEAAALASQIPFGGNSDTYGLEIEARPGLGPGERPAPQRYAVTPGYLETFRIPLRRGRLLTDNDGPDSEPVILVNEAAAGRIWPGEDPLGQRVRLGGPDAPFRRIVGVVGDVRHDDLTAAPPLQMYLPQSQMTDAFLTLVVRTPIDPAALLASVRREVHAVAPAVPVYNLAPVRDLVARAVAERRFLMRLLAAFAGLALLLAAMGVYGVLAWWIAQRMPEMAIRLALGAQPAQIGRLVLRQGLLVVLAGVAAGVAAALALTRSLESQLYGVEPGDPATLAAIAAIVLGAAIVATVLPALRAARADPTELLRSE